MGYNLLYKYRNIHEVSGFVLLPIRIRLIISSQSDGGGRKVNFPQGLIGN